MTVSIPPATCGPYAFVCNVPGEFPPVPADALPVINVQPFFENQVCSEPDNPPGVWMREALRQAALAVPDSGGVLYIPEGTYDLYTDYCVPIALKSNTWVRGAGAGATVLHLVRQGGRVFWIAGIENVRISDLSIDVDHGVCTGGNPDSTGNFTSAIQIQAMPDPITGQLVRCRNVFVERCEIYTSDAPTRGQTLHAVVAQGCDGVWVRDCRFRRMQVKASGADGSTRIFILRNHFLDSHNLAISAVVDSTVGVLTDLVIADNVVENLPSAGGIFLGNDGETHPGDVAANVIVRNNVLRGVWAADTPTDWDCDGTIEDMSGSVGILIDIPPNARNWTISGNLLENTAAAPAQGTTGIVIQSERRMVGGVTQEVGYINGLIVSGNSVRNIDHAGIQINCAMDGLVVSDNHVHNARGIRVNATAGGITDAVISANTCVGHVTGIELAAFTGSVRNARISDNTVIHNTAQWGWTGIRLSTSASNQMSAEVAGNRCVPSATAGGSTGLLEVGTSFVGMRYLDNDLSALTGSHTPLSLVNTAAVVHGNAGAPNQGGNVATIPAGANYVDVPHGIAVPVQAKDVSITGLTYPSSWGSRALLWVTIPNATHIRINSAQAPGSGQSATVAWRVSV